MNYKETLFFVGKCLTISHNEKNKAKCGPCEKYFFDTYQLKRHMESIHLKKTKVECDKCPNMYSTFSNLKLHYKLMHDDKKEFKCEFCGKEFGMNSEMKKHILAAHVINMTTILLDTLRKSF